MKRPWLTLVAAIVLAVMPSMVFAELKEGFVQVLQGETFQSVEAAALEEPELADTLWALAVEKGIQAPGPLFRHQANENVLIVPLEPALPTGDSSLTLFFDRSSKEKYFLLLSAEPGIPGGGSVRLWSDGLTEIVIDARGIYYSPVPSAGTFRLPVRADKGIADNLLCLARLLGFTINPTRLDTAISSIACNVFSRADIARNIVELVLIGGHCFSAVNCLGFCPASNALCLTGLAKWISCGIAECGGGSTVLSAPQLTDPANGATVSGSAVTLSWSRVDGATKYQTELSRSSSFSSPITGSEVSTTSARWTNFPNDGSSWYWRVRAGNAQGWSQWSSSRYFINGGTSRVPQAPTLVSPANGARISGSSVTLTMGSVAGATRYQTQLSRDSSFSNPVTGNEYTTTSVRWINFPNDGSRWYWRARAGNSQGWSQWSSSRSFINGQ